LRLKQSNGIDCVVYEIRDKPSTIGGAVNIPPNGVRLFHELGLYDELNARASSISKLTLGSAPESPDFQYAVGEECMHATGFGVWRVLRSDLIKVLYTAVQRENIKVVFGKRLTKVVEMQDAVQIAFDDGTEDSAAMLLGCDGIHSAVRKLHIDPQVEPMYSGVSNMFAILPSTSLVVPAPREPKMSMTFTSDGLFSVVPCTASGEHLYWFYSRKVAIPDDEGSRDGWEAYGQKAVQDLKRDMYDVLKDITGAWGDALRGLISATETVKFYPVYKMSPSCRWSTGRCLLLGDAAHAMQPHLGQGTSMALEDVFLLSRLLESRPAKLDETFARYEQIRRPRVEKISQGATHTGNLRGKLDPKMSQTREEVLAAQWRDGARMKDYLYNILDVKL
jgi:2-polyprenyl-6-methoxyphenol hydroxylase-like FAD-dependent oxidoreductase